PTLDYSYTLVLRDESNAVVARQDDGLAWLDGTPTSAWNNDDIAPGQIELTLPDELAPGEYSVWLGTYYWETPTDRLEIESGSPAIVDRANQLVKLGQIVVES
ncbi:MAG: hypothetical protein D6737_00755, partial [Chloroflexi bacterium]